MQEDIEWREPAWSIARRKETIGSIFLNRETARIFGLIISVGIVIVVILSLNTIGQKHIGLIMQMIAILVAAVLIIGLLRLGFQHITPAMTVVIRHGGIFLGGSTVCSTRDGDTASMETDNDGHRWLVVHRGPTVVRLGVADEVRTSDIEDRLRRVS